MPKSRHRTGSLLLGVLLVLLLSGCSPGASSRLFGFGARAPREATRVEVVNDHFADVTVYAMARGARIRLGEVTGKNRETFSLSQAQLPPGSTLRLLVDPLGSGRTFLSDEVFPGRGAVVVLNVASVLQMSYVTLR